jgi:hypothetical protein
MKGKTTEKVKSEIKDKLKEKIKKTKEGKIDWPAFADSIKC